MDISGKRAFALLKKLAYVRVGGSKEETRAAETLLEEARALGVQSCIETFPIHEGEVKLATLKVVAPYEKEYACTGYIRSDSTPEGGLEADLVYVENAARGNLQNLKGKVALINGRLGYKLYEKLMKAGVAGIIGYSGELTDRESESDLDIRKLRETLTDAFGFTVAVNVRARSAAEMVLKKASRVQLNVVSQRFDVDSRNVCCVVPGTEFPDEIISVGGHYDSVHFSTGVYDNMAGTVITMELMRYFAAHPARRTLCFNCYGSEEQGLLGSKAYCAAHKDELDKHVMMINIDVAGAILGGEKAIVTGSEALAHYVEAAADEAGLALDVTRDIYSSDCIPFADNGIPAINFMRPGAPGAGYIHDRRDNLKNGFMSADALASTATVALEIVRRLANAAIFPAKKEIPDDIRDKVDDYLFKKK